ncbi:PREDICTED: DDB1- and CUL4-associated factor 8-like isoform X2 [Rhagoletis zephyria]|uniref:DDB1- and CUL4-associated factor 8-like isoform X1 n=1 Tax=Rhagoletis zephyria TaxID=28612 RepID=UPI000811265A|nr:PREDICTED: DDB1- and CUL4-associated factor 8-like isoform X1 [Rhagoletis zephyria]XP_017484172.1 PREDICTED: DDB1- and CUL4-associated factor 8-like isoform X2 [Rhagoletis zephyria]
MEDRSTSKKVDTHPDTDEMTIMEVTSCIDKATSSPLSANSNTTPSSTVNEESEIRSAGCIKMELTKYTTDTEEEVIATAMEDESAAATALNSNTAETPTFPRRTRRGTRNYRQSTQDDECEEEPPGRNSSVVDGTEEEQMPLLSVTPAPAEGDIAENNLDASMPSERESSPAASSPIVTSGPFDTSTPNFTDDDDDDDDEDEDDDVDDVDDDDDDDDETEDEEEHNSSDNSEHANALADVMNKPKPQYTWCSTYELMRREHGLSGDGRRSLASGMSPGFNARFYAARHVVERMKISHRLLKHNGCVNCLNFNRSGDLLCSGSDDMRIVVWNWPHKKPKLVFKSGHTENIFQTKFINSLGVLDIVSAGRDGQVLRSIVPPSGGKPQTSFLYRHMGSVHKLVISPNNPFEIISAGEDARIRRKDLRSDESATILCKVDSIKMKKIRLFSIAHHPYAPEICVCGCDNFVRVYDKRNMNKPVHQMCPDHLVKASIPQVTCAVYNSTGSEVLASYSDDHIYLFNNNEYKTGEYTHRYRGHYNHKTIKGVNFFGPNSEYVISGSDCGNIFFWDKNTEAIVNFMPGDTMGVVNCLEPHPTIPVLATSGLDSTIKIWTPSSEMYPPDLSKLEACVKRNLRRSLFGEGRGFDGREFHYFIRQFLRRPPRRVTYLTGEDVGEQTDSSSSDGLDSDGLDCPRIEGIQCHTQ